ncbi:MAG: zinc metalloprotease HtpX [Chloroflexi bacterium]|nr:zinc metalloprotease HtpX [Chloroflexota bacterium]
MARSRWRGGDGGLAGRMLLVMGLLALVYLGFLAFLVFLDLPLPWLLVIAAVLLGAQYFFSDKLVLLSLGAREVSPQQAPDLHERIERLCALSDLPKPRVAIIQHDMPNALATGRDPQHAVVAVTTGLLRRLEGPELDAVLAHELSHILNRDVMVMTIASFFSTVAFFLFRSLFYVRLGGGRDRRGNGSAVLVLWVVSLAVWLVSMLLLRALSRYREVAADRGSALITGSPSHLAAALVKISGSMARIPKDDLRAVEGANAFFIVPALSELIATHPSLETRLRYLQELEREMERP